MDLGVQLGEFLIIEYHILQVVKLIHFFVVILRLDIFMRFICQPVQEKFPCDGHPLLELVPEAFDSFIDKCIAPQSLK